MAGAKIINSSLSLAKCSFWWCYTRAPYAQGTVLCKLPKFNLSKISFPYLAVNLLSRLKKLNLENTLTSLWPMLPYNGNCSIKSILVLLRATWIEYSYFYIFDHICICRKNFTSTKAAYTEYLLRIIVTPFVHHHVCYNWRDGALIIQTS